jgi:hypothetical protein
MIKVLRASGEGWGTSVGVFVTMVTVLEVVGDNGDSG